MPLENSAENFHPIDSKILDKNSSLVFDIYCKVQDDDENRFVLYASKKPRYREKVRALLRSSDFTEELFIHEQDLAAYFEYATNALRDYVINSDATPEKKMEKVYDLSRDVTHQFFEANSSPEILRGSGQVVELMEKCLEDNKLGFHGLSKIMEKDYYTYTHSINVGLYCMSFALKIGMPADEVHELGLGGMLHDVGKSTLPQGIINKIGSLTEEEFEMVKQHTDKGEAVLRGLGCYGEKVIQVVGQHHEKYNGEGYHQGLVGDDIALFARICKLTDVYDALTTRRSYKKSLKPLEALTIMKSQMGHEFDPKLLNAFIRMMGPQG
ncbi:MAG: HD-GYP domain-containing protein [Nitrospinae bacterium]|nr:HD-GYP domain-containing protein [Nitrospinota bacterium]MBL7018938.1 HD-GYP domain-containing protein [Nitrospinaceae bacterium]